MRTIYYIIICCLLLALINGCSKERGPVIGVYDCTVKKSTYNSAGPPYASLTTYKENIVIKRHWLKKIEVFGQTVILNSDKTFGWSESPPKSGWGFSGSFFSEDSLYISFYTGYGQENRTYKGKKVD